MPSLRLSALQRLTLGETRMTTGGLARLRAGLPALRQLYMPRPGRRVAGERARAAVLAILAGRLRPERSDAVSPEEELRVVLPTGSRIAEIRRDGQSPKAVDWRLDDLDVAAIWLPKLGTGCELRVVTPGGMDVWVPWLRSRGRTDRRRARSASVAPRVVFH